MVERADEASHRPEPTWARPVRRATRLAVGVVLAVGDQVARVAIEATDTGSNGSNGSTGSDAVAPAPVTTPVPAALDDAGFGDDTTGTTGATVPATIAGTDPPGLRPVVLGALFAAEDRVIDWSGRLSRVAPVAEWMWDRPLVRPVRRRVDEGLVGLRSRGTHEEAEARAAASKAFGVTVSTATASPVIDEVVDDVVGRIIDPVLRTALPKAFVALEEQPEQLVPLVEAIVGEVLQPILDSALPTVMDLMKDRPELIVPMIESLVGEIIDPVLQEALPKAIDYLNQDPTVVRDLVRDQSTGIAGELAGTVRLRAVDVDDRIDRIAARLLRRPRTPKEVVAAEPPRELPPAPGTGDAPAQPSGSSAAPPAGDAPAGDEGAA
jgi:hypothetical protein